MQIQVRRRLKDSSGNPVSRSTLWRACSTLSGLALWQADAVEGAVQAGKSLQLAWPALGVEMQVRVVDVQRERRMIYENGPSRVSLEIESGLLTLTQTGLSRGDQAEGMYSSWTLALALLEHSLARHPEKPRAATWLVRHVQAPPELVYALASDDIGLRTWLTRGGCPITVGSVGDRIELTLPDGSPLAGRVLASVEGRDLAYTWEQQGDSVLVLRTLPSPLEPGSRLLALVHNRWGADAGSADPQRELLESCLDRLASLVRRSGSA